MVDIGHFFARVMRKMKVLAVSFDEYRDNEQRICECGVEKARLMGKGESVDGDKKV